MGTSVGTGLSVVGLAGLLVIGLSVVAARIRAAARPGTPPARPGREPDPMHVLHLASADPATAKRTAEIDRRLAAAGHRVTVMVPRGPGAVDRTEVHGAGTLRWVHLGLGRGAHRLTRRLGHLVAVPLALRSVGADVVVADLVAPHSSCAVPRIARCPVVGIVPGRDTHRLGRVGVRRHRTLVAASQAVADDLHALCPRATVHVVAPGVADDAFRPRRRGPGSDVVSAGGPDGLDLLVDAWARLAGRVPGRLVLAGAGPDEAALRRRAECHGIADRVHVAGPMSGETRYDLLANARVAVIPARGDAGGVLAIAAAEALACGTAVVARDVPGLREVVRPELGVLVPPTGEHVADVAALAVALRAVIVGDGIRNRAAARGPELAAAHGWDGRASLQEAILREAAARRVSGAPARAAVPPARVVTGRSGSVCPTGVVSREP